MNPNTTVTLLAVNKKRMECTEWPVSTLKPMKGRVFDWSSSLLIYGYILNRNPNYRDKWYGWGLVR